MTVRYLSDHAALEGFVGVDDAEPLSRWLRSRPQPAVHLGACEQVHGAVLQALLALAPCIVAAPADAWLRAALGPAPGPQGAGSAGTGAA